MKRKNKKGFTLIELVIVLAVLGIIVAIAIPNYLKVKNKAKIDAYNESGLSLAKTLEIAIASNYIDTPNSNTTIIITPSNNDIEIEYSEGNIKEKIKPLINNIENLEKSLLADKKTYNFDINKDGNVIFNEYEKE